MSPIAPAFSRGHRGTIGEALRGLGRAWWIYVLVGQWGAFVIGGVVIWPLSALAALWLVLAVTRLGSAIPTPWSARLRQIAAGGSVTLVVCLALTFASAIDAAKVVQILAVDALTIAYIVDMRAFCSTYQGSGGAVQLWSKALAWATASMALGAFLLADGGAAVASGLEHGSNPLTVMFGIGIVSMTVAGIGTLVLLARAHSTFTKGYSIMPS